MDVDQNLGSFQDTSFDGEALDSLDDQLIQRRQSTCSQSDYNNHDLIPNRDNWQNATFKATAGDDSQIRGKANTAGTDAGAQKLMLSGLALFLNKLRDRYGPSTEGVDSAEQLELSTEDLSKEDLLKKYEEYKETAKADMLSVCDSALNLSSALSDLTDQVESYSEMLSKCYDKKKEDEARIKELEDKAEELNLQWKDKMTTVLEELDMAQQMLADHRVTNVRSHRPSPADGEDDSNRTSAQQYEIEMLEEERNKLRKELAEVTARLNKSDLPLESELEKKDRIIALYQDDLDRATTYEQQMREQMEQLMATNEQHIRTRRALESKNEELKKDIEALMTHVDNLTAQTTRPVATEGETLEDLEGSEDLDSLSCEQVPSRVQVAKTVTTEKTTEIHYHIHHHAHAHTHQHDHQHDHYHQYGILTGSAVRGKVAGAVNPVVLSMTQGDAIYSNVDLDLKNKMAETIITGKKKKVKKNFTAEVL